MNNKEQQDSNKIVYSDGITYVIKEDNTASVIHIDSTIDIFIPRSIKYETKEYIITSISQCSFQSCAVINSFQFAANSEVQTIEKNAFQSMTIKNLSIPSKLTELKDGWLEGIFLIDKITVSPDNPRYSMYEDQFVIGKSKIEQENYDVLIFCSRSIEGKIQIPDFIEIIGPHAFESCDKIQQIEFSPESKLRIISNFSFSSTAIEQINIPEKVTHICGRSFFFCRQLKKIEFPKNSQLEMIGEFAFFGTLIESISIPSKVTELKGGCFVRTKIDKITVSPDNPRYSMYKDQFVIGKSSIEQENYDVLIYCPLSIEGKIQIPDFIEIIGTYAFECHKLIKQVEFSPDSKLRIIEKGSFQDSSITCISIPPKVTKICENSFCCCKELTEVVIPENSELQIIEKNGFSDSKIKNFSIPSKLTELKDEWCSQLILDKITVSPDNPRYSMYEDQFVIGKSSIEQENYDVLIFCSRSIEGKIRIPDFIEIIGPHAFENCDKIQQVEFSPDSKLRIIGKESFQASSITSIYIPPKVKIIDQKSFHKTYCLKKVDFDPDSLLEKICNGAFSYCSIDNISLPSSLIEIEENSFSSTKNLQEVQFSEDSQLQTIGKNAFDSSNIRKIIIPKHIKTISEKCFKYSKIEQIGFHNDSELVFIETAAFDHSNIQSIKIPKTVNKIGEGCFSYCNLKNVEIPEDSELQNIESRAFQSTSIQRIFIPKHVKILENDVFITCKNLEQVDFAPDSELEIIGRSVFQMTSIKEISIPRHVKIINGNAFSCRKLEHIEIPENSELQKIKRFAFSNSSIKSFYIPSKLTVLEDGWLEGIFQIDKITVSPDNPRYSMYEDQFVIGKSSIERENYDVLIFCSRSIEGKIQIPDFIEIIGQRAFENCNKIQQIEFSPDSKLRIIDSNSFAYTSIKQIKIPAKVTQICDQAFYYCQQLKNIEILKDSQLEMIGEIAFLNTLIENISIPSKVTELKKRFLAGASKLQIISVSSRNQLYSTYDEGKFIIKKSSIEQQNYDILVFCIGKLHYITIPSFIKVLADGLFCRNNNIRQVNFQHDSKIEIFGESAFELSKIEKISIPSSLKIIGLNCFFNCLNLKKICIPDDSQLEVFDNSLYGTGITSLFIPRHVKQIKNSYYGMYRYLKIIEIDENCEIKIFNISMLDGKILMISSKLRNQINFTRLDY